MKASIVATVCAATQALSSGRKANSGTSSRAIDGSPTQPSARLASVMPSCVAAIASSRLSIACLHGQRRPTGDALTISSTRVRRTATRANSAATKNAFASTNSGTTSTPST